MIFDVKELPKELYLDADACEKFLHQDFDIVSTDPVTFHFFWNGAAVPFGQKHEACIRTFLKTQPDHYTAKIWVDAIPKVVFGDRVEFVIYNGEDVSKGTPLEGLNKGLSRDKEDTNCWAHSDIGRLLILYKFGGIYYDFDNLFQRDLSPLMHIPEFVYCWPFAPKALCNAIIKAEAGSEFIRDCLITIREKIEEGQKLAGDFAGRPTLSKQHRKNPYKMVVLPCGVFHPEFAAGCRRKEDVDKDPFNEHTSTFLQKNVKSRNVYWGAFSWHWHNKWKDGVENNSKFDIICKNIGIAPNKKHMDPKFIICTGTGRCGTKSITKLFGLQADTTASHEMGVYDKKHDNITVAYGVDIQKHNKLNLISSLILKHDSEFIVESAFYLLHHAEIAIQKYDAKVIYLLRDRKEVVDSFMKITSTKRNNNHWQTHDGTEYQKHTFDVCFPKFDDAINKEDAIGKYWDYCYEMITGLILKYPNNIRIYKTEDISNKDLMLDMLTWCGYKNPVFADVVWNKS